MMDKRLGLFVCLLVVCSVFVVGQGAANNVNEFGVNTVDRLTFTDPLRLDLTTTEYNDRLLQRDRVAEALFRNDLLKKQLASSSDPFVTDAAEEANTDSSTPEPTSDGDGGGSEYDEDVVELPLVDVVAEAPADFLPDAAECSAENENVAAFDANSFLKSLGAQEKPANEQQAVSDSEQTLDPQNLVKEGDKFVVGEFNAENAAADNAFEGQWKSFTALNSEDKAALWDQLEKTPELKRNFLDVMSKQLAVGDEEFDLFSGVEANDLPDINWDDQGRMTVGFGEDSEGVTVDLCAIEQYNNKVAAGGDGNTFKYSIEGTEYEGANNPLKGVSYDSEKGVVYDYGDFGSLSVASGSSGERYYDVNSRQLYVKSGEAESVSTWVNNRGKVELSGDGTLTVGMTTEGTFDSTGRNFAIMEVGNGEDKQLLSSYQKFTGTGAKPAGGKSVFSLKDGVVTSVNKDGKQFVVQDAVYSLLDGKSHVVNGYSEVADKQELGQFFFGDAVKDTDGKVVTRNGFDISKNTEGEDLVLLHGNVLYEQMGNMGAVNLNPEGEQVVVNGNNVFSRGEDGKLAVRTLDGKKAGKSEHNGALINNFEKDGKAGRESVVMSDGTDIAKRYVAEVKDEPEGEGKSTGDTGSNTVTNTGSGGSVKIGSSSYSTGKLVSYSGGSISEIATASQQQDIILKIGAPWCGPCNAEVPGTQSFAQQNQNVLVLDVNGDNYPNLVDSYGITGYPTFIRYSRGNIVKRGGSIDSVN